VSNFQVLVLSLVFFEPEFGFFTSSKGSHNFLLTFLLQNSLFMDGHSLYIDMFSKHVCESAMLLTWIMRPNFIVLSTRLIYMSIASTYFLKKEIWPKTITENQLILRPQ